MDFAVSLVDPNQSRDFFLCRRIFRRQTRQRELNQQRNPTRAQFDRQGCDKLKQSILNNRYPNLIACTRFQGENNNPTAHEYRQLITAVRQSDMCYFGFSYMDNTAPWLYELMLFAIETLSTEHCFLESISITILRYLPPDSYFTQLSEAIRKNKADLKHFSVQFKQLFDRNSDIGLQQPLAVIRNILIECTQLDEFEMNDVDLAHPALKNVLGEIRNIKKLRILTMKNIKVNEQSIRWLIRLIKDSCTLEQIEINMVNINQRDFYPYLTDLKQAVWTHRSIQHIKMDTVVERSVIHWDSVSMMMDINKHIGVVLYSVRSQVLVALLSVIRHPHRNMKSKVSMLSRDHLRKLADYLV